MTKKEAISYLWSMRGVLKGLYDDKTLYLPGDCKLTCQQVLDVFADAIECVEKDQSSK